MEDDFMKEKWLYIAIFVTGLLGFIIIELVDYYAASSYAGTLWVPSLGFLKGLMMTFMTASIVSWMVDRVARAYNARRLANERSEIRDDVFRSVYSRFFSDKVLNEFDATLFAAEVMKLNTRIEIDLKHKNGAEFSDEWFLVEYKHSYRLKNVTSGEISHPIKLVLELPLRERFKNMCRITRVEIDKEVMTGAQLEQKGLITTCDDYKTFERHKKLKEGDEIEVSFSYQTLKKKEDYELIVMLVPTEDICIRATAGSGTVLKADSNNSKELNLREYNHNDCQWDLNHGLLPYQSITVWWKDHPNTRDASRTKNGVPPNHQSVKNDPIGGTSLSP